MHTAVMPGKCVQDQGVRVAWSKKENCGAEHHKMIYDCLSIINTGLTLLYQQLHAHS